MSQTVKRWRRRVSRLVSVTLDAVSTLVELVLDTFDLWW